MAVGGVIPANRTGGGDGAQLPWIAAGKKEGLAVGMDGDKEEGPGGHRGSESGGGADGDGLIKAGRFESEASEASERAHDLQVSQHVISDHGPLGCLAVNGCLNACLEISIEWACNLLRFSK